MRQALFSTVIFLSLVRGCLFLYNDMPAKRLHRHLFKSYNKLIRPTGHKGTLTVQLAMRLAQILDIDEKNQIMSVSVWLRHEWNDQRLRWDPSLFGGITHLHIPSDNLWRPDIVLYNNADGDFIITLLTKAKVHHTGRLVWEPPAIYKSYCPIDVEFFPFDMQECFMKFSSWTYDGLQVDLQHFCTLNNIHNINKTIPSTNEEIVIDKGIDLTGYYQNVEWDVINVTARRNVKFYQCCPEPYPDITFNVTIRRRTLFYSVNLMVPCMSISCMCVLVFYLPSDSGEKITLSISILLALTVFFLLLSDLIPPTSFVIPLIGKYLLFTMIVVTMSIILTIFVLSIHYRSPSTHKMSPWVRRMFTEILPTILLMKRPEVDRKKRVAIRTCNGIELRDSVPGGSERNWEQFQSSQMSAPQEEGDLDSSSAQLLRSRHPAEVTASLQGVRFIADQMKEEDATEDEIRDWKYVAMVMDRFFLFIFTTACFTGTMSIFLHAPSLYDPRMPLTSNGPNQTCIY